MPLIDSDEFRSYFLRIRPIFSQMYNIAHLITGNADSAEYCVQCAILDCWLAEESAGSVHGFREAFRRRTIRAALKARKENREFDWTDLQLTDTDSTPALIQLRKEPVEQRRVLSLHYACGFSPRKCASICGIEPRRARSVINRFEKRIARKLSAQDRRRVDSLLPKIFRDLLSRPDPDAPEAAAVFRTFQSDASDIRKPARLPARIARVAFAVVLTVLCMVGFFLAAVLIQPASIEAPQPLSPTPTAFEDTFHP